MSNWRTAPTGPDVGTTRDTQGSAASAAAPWAYRIGPSGRGRLASIGVGPSIRLLRFHATFILLVNLLERFIVSALNSKVVAIQVVQQAGVFAVARLGRG